MTKRIVLVLTVLMTLFTVTTAVASADSHTMKPDGIWEMNDGDDWIRFFERGRMKQAQWHSDSYGPCGGPATSTSANWWHDADGVHLKVWANCDRARIRLRPFEKTFQWAWDGDLVEPDGSEWQNYLYHAPPPECIDFGDHSIYATNVVGLDLVIDIPDGVFDFTLGNYVAEIVCNTNGCDNWHVDITISDTLDEPPFFFPIPPFIFPGPPAGTFPDVLILEAAGATRPCETIQCAVQGFVSLPTPIPPGWDETNIAGYATCEAIFGP